MNIMLNNAFDFDYVIIEKYKELNLTENQLATILVLDNLIKQGNDFVTADMLAMKMSLSIKEIDSILVTLMEKNLLEYDTSKNTMRTTLKPLYERLARMVQNDILEEKGLSTQKESKDKIDTITTKLENGLERKLTPLEKDKVMEWVLLDYSLDVICSSIDEALVSGKKTIRSMDKIILKKNTRDDISKEGFSARNDNYHKDVDTTIENMKQNWNK